MSRILNPSPKKKIDSTKQEHVDNMIMEKLGKAISRYPKTTVVATITLTLIAVGCIQIFGINQEFSEESFLPDIDIVKASEEISSNYTGSYTVSILVKSQATDVLTAKSLVEMLQIEKQIIEDPAIIPLLETPEAPPLNVNSVADIIAQMAYSHKTSHSPPWTKRYQY